MRNVTPAFSRTCKWVCSLLMMILLAAAPAFSQINPQSPGQHKQERKKYLKQANSTDSKYKDTHLNVNAYNFKIGETGRKRVKNDERARYEFDDAGEPVKKKRLFNRKKKKKK